MLFTAGSTRRWIGAPTAIVLVAVLSTSCSGGESEPDGPGLGTSGGPAITAPETTDEDEIRSVYDAYWAAVVESENGPDPSRELFEGVATGDALERQIFRVQGLVANKIRRVGEPEIGDPLITIDDATARVEACINQDPWLAVVDGSTPTPQPSGPRPMVVGLEKFDDQWYVIAQVPQEEAALTC